MHTACGFPVKSTRIKAIEAGNFEGWPLLTAKRVKKYYPETVETSKGHLNQTQQNMCSTKPKPFEEPKTDKLKGNRYKDVYIKVYNMREKIFSHQTGRFPKTSFSGNKYIMVMIKVDSNVILVKPLKAKHDDKMQRAYKHLILRLKRTGVKPKKHVMDNKISASMKNMIRDEYNMELKLVPPGCHRRNAAEIAIRFF